MNENPLSPTDNPVRVVALINAAITATLGVLIAVGVSETLVVALTGMFCAWVLVWGEVVRGKVAPMTHVRSLKRRGGDSGQITVGLVLTVLVIVLAILAVLMFLGLFEPANGEAGLRYLR